MSAEFPTLAERDAAREAEITKHYEGVDLSNPEREALNYEPSVDEPDTDTSGEIIDEDPKTDPESLLSGLL